MRAVRVWFAKTGGAKYISHLDLNRCMLRAVSRARLPVWYTEGFNPHPYITFALPLSLGIESLGEPMDMRIEGDMSDEEIKARLACVMPEGLEIKTVCTAADDAKVISYAEYGITLEFQNEKDAAVFCDAAKTLVDSGRLKAQKSGKQGRHKVKKEIALNDYIYGFDAESALNTVELNAVLSAGNTANLNPNLLLECLSVEIPIEIGYAKILRKRILKADFEAFQ